MIIKEAAGATDQKDVGRAALTILGLAILAVAAIFVARRMVRPAKEKVERSREVLTKAYDARLDECVVPEDADISAAGLEPPEVGADWIYLLVVVLYPGAAQVPEPDNHTLIAVDDRPGTRIEPSKVSTTTEEEGAFLELIFKVDATFDHARLVRDDSIVLRRVGLE